MIVRVKTKQLPAKLLYRAFVRNGVEHFYGVPDSTLSPFGSYLDTYAKDSHDIAVNEGSAVALAIGFYLATSKLPLVYMQNSGLGNAINPLVSLADPLVMGIPMLLLIGWRGQPGKKDEPQHTKQGLITGRLLETLGIPYAVLSSDISTASEQIKKARIVAEKNKQPFALLAEPGIFKPNKLPAPTAAAHLSRESAIKQIVRSLEGFEAVVATTGKTGRELFEYRQSEGQSHHKELLVVGGMGHASTIAAAVAQHSPNKVYCLDGDGAVLMHMGALAAIGASSLNNFYHIVLNNGTHESVGGQPTIGRKVDLPNVALACGYAKAYTVKDMAALDNTLRSFKKDRGPVFLEVIVSSSSRPNLGRPNVPPSANKENFMSYLSGA